MARLSPLAIFLALLVAACGSSTGTSATTLAIEDGTDTEGEHEHSTDNAREWDGGEPPTVQVSVTGDPDSGYLLRIELENFVLTTADVIEPEPGHGHVHVFVDGRLLTMGYEPEARLPELEPGTHQVMVTLGTNDHLDYVLDGEPIMSMTELVVPGEVEAADRVVEVTYLGGQISVEVMVASGEEGVTSDRLPVPLGSIVEIVALSDVAEEVHVHGYDVLGRLTAGEAATIRFVADIPGIFEVELEESGVLLFELEIS